MRNNIYLNSLEKKVEYLTVVCGELTIYSYSEDVRTCASLALDSSGTVE